MYCITHKIIRLSQVICAKGSRKLFRFRVRYFSGLKYYFTWEITPFRNLFSVCPGFRYIGVRFRQVLLYYGKYLAQPSTLRNSVFSHTVYLSVTLRTNNCHTPGKVCFLRHTNQILKQSSDYIYLCTPISIRTSELELDFTGYQSRHNFFMFYLLSHENIAYKSNHYRMSPFYIWRINFI